jgi:CRISPR-associated protein (TIGR02710 family)
MSKALIISVGGTPDPVITAIVYHKPAFVCFFASQESLDKIGTVKEKVCEKWPEAGYEDRKVVVNDRDEIAACYEKALECFTATDERGFGPQNRVADITGGTKAMSAALAIALSERGGSFSYVGGKQRDKEGLGVVVTGYEQMRESVNPLRRYASEQKRRARELFNAHHYQAAADALGALPSETDEREKAVLEAVREAAHGYALWDRFHHKEAVEKLKSACNKLAEQRRLLAADKRFGWHTRFADEVAQNLGELRELQEQTHGFKKLHPMLAADLAAGAKRRIESGAFDDAVARLYRVIEMLGQCEFERVFEMKTGEVDAARLPEELREEYKRRYSDEKSGRLKLPLSAVFRALEGQDSDLGRKFAQESESLKGLLSARNDSLLAHGVEPVKETTAGKMLELVRGWLPADAPLVQFPRWELE